MPFGRAAQGDLDAWATLEIAPGASQAQIRQAYRRLARQWHPDGYGDAPTALRAFAEQRMRAINSAYATLRSVPDDDPFDDPFDEPFSSLNWTLDSARDVLVDPNGAGNFIGVLCLVVVVALAGRLVLGTAGSTFYLTIGALLLFVPLMVLAFDANSPVARRARRWAEEVPAPHMATHMAAPVNDEDDDGEDDSENASEGDWWEPAPAPAVDGDEEVSPATPGATGVWTLATSALFEDAVTQALDALPEAYARHLGQVHICVRSEPDDETRHTMGLAPGQTLFGLYTGVPLTRQSFLGAPQPETVTLYAGPIWRATGGNPAALREQVRRTLLHELAHHFGIDHDDMPDWIR